MPHNGEIRKFTKVFIHDDKVIKRQEKLQRYYVWYNGFFTQKGSWEDIDEESKVVEVRDLDYFKKMEKEGALDYV